MAIQLTQLPNGLRIVTDPLPYVETAALGVWVDVGTRHEPASVNGIAHVLEHMAFKGTQRRSALRIAEEVEAVGGYLNAYTSREITAYHARLLKEDVSLGVDILADILQYSTFDPQEFAREQGVIIQEIGQTNDTPDDVVFDYYQELCFPNQSMGRPILGNEEIIRSLTPEIVKDYMKQHYGPKEMVLSAAGNVNHDHIVGLASQLFTDLPDQCTKYTDKARFQGGLDLRDRDLEQVHIVLGYEGVPYNHDDYYAISVLSTLLGGGMSSRLFQEIRERRGLVYSVYSYASSYRDTGTFTIYAGTGPEHVAELMPVLYQELHKVSLTLQENEIQRAKAQLKASLLMGSESTSARCEQAARQVLIYGKTIPAKELINRIDAVHQDQIVCLAERLFSQRQGCAALGPLNGLEKYFY